MSYNSSHPQDVYQYAYPPQVTYHYVSDGSPLGTGDESNFWSSSPRSDSPSPSSTMQNNLINSYQYLPQITRNSNDTRYSPYRTAYQGNVGIGDSVTTQAPTPFVRVVKRRTTANKKERRRTQSINNAYADLRDCIPNVPPDTKLSKIKTLRLATSYINYLVKALESDDPAGGFTAELGSVSRKSTNNNPIQVNDCTTGQISPKSDISEDMNKTRKAKGRTGWPQHVWALELEQDQPI